MLAERLRNLRPRQDKGRNESPIDQRPGCTYGAVTGQRVADLADVVARIEGKVNAALLGIASAVVIEIVRSVRL
ncbi:MAG: hypothetical protein M0Z94_11455 [Dehalococcoidales bacterium]|nr:hypothetical protein [Dehalococcoidales bacterium]